jgi:hypothetical protein
MTYNSITENYSSHLPILTAEAQEITGCGLQTIRIDYYNELKELLGTLSISVCSNSIKTTTRMFTFIYDLELQMLFENVISTFMKNIDMNSSISPQTILDILMYSAPFVPTRLQSHTS